MPNPVRYNPNIVELKGGLDFVTPRITAMPGALTDCFNFEVDDRLGYKRIDGLEPFDGRDGPSNVYNSLVYIRVAGDSVVGTFAPGDCIRGDQDINGIPIRGDVTFGVVVDFRPIPSSGDLIIVATITNLTEFYRTAFDAGNTVTVGTPSNGVAGNLELVDISVLPITDVYEQYNYRKDVYANLDGLVETTPAGRYYSDGTIEDGEARYSPVTGMKWYKNRLHITQDITQYIFNNGTGDIKAGDILTGNDFSDEIRVLSYKVISGSLESGTGRVSVLGRSVSGSHTVAQDYTVYRNSTAMAGSTLTMVTNTGLNNYGATWHGGMWRSTSFSQAGFNNANLGWEEVDLGYNFSFKDGLSSGPPSRIGRTGTATKPPDTETSAGLITQTAVAPDIRWSLQGGATDFVDAIDTPSDSKFARYSAVGWGGDAYLTASNFTGLENIPSDAVISGIEVKVRGRFTAATFNTGLRIQVTLDAEGSVAKTTDILTNTFADYVVGGSGDMWGTKLTRRDIDSDFAIKITGVKPRNSQPSIWDVDYVEVKISFQETVSRYYFFDGTNEVVATVTNVKVNSGDWTTNDAQGQLQVVAVEPVFGPKAAILAGDEMWTVSQTASPGSGTQLLTVESDMDYSGVPSWQAMKAEDSRAQIIVANFYANEEWEAMYAAYGAGRAWLYDGFYFRYIYTGLPDTNDKPRHVLYHKARLALGYRAGSVALSVAGDPESFDGTLGAAEIGTGDPVVGLIRMNGGALGIPCREAWYGLYGSTVDDFQLELLNPYEGAIEYTVVDIGRPIYTSNKGISTFDQTAAYGNFLGSRLSAKITSWLLPRLTGKLPPTLVEGFTNIKETPYRAASQGPAMALQCRSKNQYRLYFEDGYVLTMTLMGPEMEPAFTIHTLYDGTLQYDDNLPLVPFAWHSTIDELGAERIHISSDHPSSSHFLFNFVYELDKGWLYRNGESANKIFGSFVANGDFIGTPFDFDQVRKLRVHGLSKGRFQMRASIIKNYEREFPAYNDMPSAWQDLSLPRDAVMPPNGPNDFVPATNLGNFSVEGRNYSVKFEEMSVDPINSERPIVQPPAVLQHFLIQTKDMKGDI